MQAILSNACIRLDLSENCVNHYKIFVKRSKQSTLTLSVEVVLASPLRTY